MNDFTKEELKELLDAIGWKLGEGQADNLTFPLEAKLKSMIENYCDIKPPTMALYVCNKYNEEWHQCECNVQQEINDIKEWLSNRPSATMDPCFDKVLVKRARLRELTSQLRKERLPTHMMDAQQMPEE